jgi:hypothetical protein
MAGHIDRHRAEASLLRFTNTWTFDSVYVGNASHAPRYPMPYIADMKLANSYLGQRVGNGQCGTFIHPVVVVPPSSEWKRGNQAARNIAIAPGTIIASFDSDGTGDAFYVVQ